MVACKIQVENNSLGFLVCCAFCLSVETNQSATFILEFCLFPRKAKTAVHQKTQAFVPDFANKLVKFFFVHFSNEANAEI